MATARVTVTLANELVAEIDRLARNRSGFVAEAVQRELTRRRRAALLTSVKRPHVDTAAFDPDLRDWVPDLPDEEGLVDSSAGTAVRWIEGDGWVEES